MLSGRAPFRLRRNAESGLGGDPGAVVKGQIDFFLPAHLETETSGVMRISGVAENGPAFELRENERAVVPFGGTEESGAVGMVVCESADSGIVCLHGDPVVSGFQIREEFDAVERPVVLISADGTAADIASVYIEPVALVRGDVERRGGRQFLHVEIVTESRVTVLQIECFRRPDPVSVRVHDMLEILMCFRFALRLIYRAFAGFSSVFWKNC